MTTTIVVKALGEIHLSPIPLFFCVKVLILIQKSRGVSGNVSTEVKIINNFLLNTQTHN